MQVDIVLGEKYSHLWSVDILYTKIVELCKVKGIDTRFIHFPPAPHWLNYIKYDLNWSAVAIRRYAYSKYLAWRSHRPGAITHITHNYAAYTKSFGARSPSCVHIQDTILEQDYGQMGNRRYKYLNDGFSNLDAFIVSSQYVGQKVRDLFPLIPEEKIHQIYPGIDYDQLPLTPRDICRDKLDKWWGIPSDKEVVLCFGADQYRKNATSAIRAFELAAKENPDLVFLKAGTSHIQAERDFIDNFIARSPIKDRIYRLYQVPQERIATMYSAAACSIFPSLDEGYGMPPLESIACGTLPIVSNLVCLPEVMGKKYPFLVNPYDVSEMATCILDIVSEDESLVRDQVIRFRNEHMKVHDLNKSVTKLVSVWESLDETHSQGEGVLPA